METPGHLASAIAARRKERLLSQEELAARAGVSLTTVRDVESGRRTSLRASNSRALCRALGWSDDSIERILAGGEPAEAAVGSSYDDRLDRLERELAALRAELGLPPRRQPDGEPRSA